MLGTGGYLGPHPRGKPVPQEESNLHPVVEIDCFVHCKFPMIALLGFDLRPKCYAVRLSPTHGIVYVVGFKPFG